MAWALADALGRRRVILVSLAVLCPGFADLCSRTRLEVLLLGRALQGFCAGAGMVVGRAMVRDVHRADGAAVDGTHQHGICHRPGHRSRAGGWIQGVADWRGVFVFLTLLGIGLWLAAWWGLPETLPPEARQSLRPVYLWRACRDMLAGREFMYLSLALALNFNGMFLYVLSAPVFLMQHLGLTAQAFAWLFVPFVAGMMLGSFISGRLAGRISERRTILLGYALMSLAAIGNLLINLAGHASLPWAIVPLPLYTLGMALAMPSLQLKALDLYPEQRGLASRLPGAVQTGISAITAALLAPLLWTTPLWLALGMAGCMTIGLGCFLQAQLVKVAR
jgi:DHA1 family bicyclomycin/chloramphenicol resistance-like MFS transporter